MSNEHNIINDRELYELFKERLLQQEQDDAFTQKLIEMETITAFSMEPMIAPGIEKEKEMLRRLSKKAGVSPGFKWLFTGLSVALVTLSLVIWMRPGTTALAGTDQAPVPPIPPALVQSPGDLPVPPSPPQAMKGLQPGIAPVMTAAQPSPPDIPHLALVATSDSWL